MAVLSVPEFRICSHDPVMGSVRSYTEAETGVAGLPLFGWNRNRMKQLHIASHYHPGRFEIHCIKSGLLTFQADGRQYPVTSGHLFVQFPDEVHEILPGPHTGHEFYWLQLPIDGRLLDLDKERSALLQKRLQRISRRVLRFDAVMLKLVETAFAAALYPTPYDRLLVSTQLTAFLVRLIAASDRLEDPGMSEEVRQAIHFMQTHLSDGVTAQQLADAAGFSLSHFNAKFKREVGVTPSDHYMGLRIEQAMKLLDQGRSVTDTACDLGFSSPNYFATVFRRVTNCTPTAYIRRKDEKGENE